MRSAHVAQLASALVATLTPWVVVRIAFRVAANQARSVQMTLARPATMTMLDRLTIAATLIAVVAALALPARSLAMGAIDLAIFAGLAVFGLRALGAIEDASRSAREGIAPVREASLKRRGLGDYISPAWRGGLIVAETTALGLFAWRVFLPVPDRRVLVPLLFALAAPVFTWLYEVWMRDIVSGGDVTTGDVDAQRRRRVRQIFLVEVVLAVTCLAVGHGLLDLDWTRHAAWGAGLALTGAAVGVVGCALAVASGLSGRRYRLV